MTSPILRTQNLTIGYPKTSKNKLKAIQSNINIQLNQGQLTCLLGVNGVGKSTLIKTLIGQIKALQGTITLKDQFIEQYNSLELSKIISVVLTEKIPLDNLKVHELVQIGRTPYLSWKAKLTNADKLAIDKAITYTNIQELLQKDIHNLSDGQLQRVLIARAIAQDTAVIILDEPSNHLDFHHKATLFSLLKNLALNENKAILFSSHDMDLALQLSDQAIVLKPNYCKQDTIDNLIAQQVFDDFFTQNNISFIPKEKRFVFRP
ncbi:ABC transporter ATP-binding protein [Myroides sp. LJL119]